MLTKYRCQEIGGPAISSKTDPGGSVKEALAGRLHAGALFEPSPNPLEQLRPVGRQLVLGLTKRPRL
jgi:hypothetical protein